MLLIGVRALFHFDKVCYEVMLSRSMFTLIDEFRIYLDRGVYEVFYWKGFLEFVGGLM